MVVVKSIPVGVGEGENLSPFVAIPEKILCVLCLFFDLALQQL
jgi:hypothetical protein